ncbi:MAG: hypothetical protein R3D51_17765 [Hyphomicrobiaceae bacterium]
MLDGIREYFQVKHLKSQTKQIVNRDDLEILNTPKLADELDELMRTEPQLDLLTQGPDGVRVSSGIARSTVHAVAAIFIIDRRVRADRSQINAGYCKPGNPIAAAVKVGLHAVVGGAVSVAQGGSFETGALTGAVAAGSSLLMDSPSHGPLGRWCA